MMNDQFSLFLDSWLYDEDTGCLLCRCPGCGCRMILYRYLDHNPYHFCPYCGLALSEGSFQHNYEVVYV